MQQRREHHRKVLPSLPFPAWLILSLFLSPCTVLAEGEQWGIRKYAEELPRYRTLVQQLETDGRDLEATENRSPRLEVTPQPVTFNTLTGMDIVRVTAKASDPDGDEVTLEFRAYNDQRTMVHREEVKLHSSEETITRTFPFRVPGTYDLIVQASDGLIAVQWYKRVVITGNRPPELTVRRGEPVWDAAGKRHRLEVNVEVIDPDAGDSISGTLQVTGPSGSPLTHVFNLKRSRDRWTDTILVTMDELGGYSLAAVVRDTRGAAARWSDQVAAFNPQNRPPTLQVVLQPLAFNKHTAKPIIKAVVDVADPDGDQVTLEFRVLNEAGRTGQQEVKLYSAQETISRTFSFEGPGSYLLLVQASDGTASTLWQQRVTIPERPVQSEKPTLEVVAAVGYGESKQQYSIEAGAGVHGLEPGATSPVYFQLYDKDGRVGEMRVKLDARDGTAMTVFHVAETGTYEVKAITQVAGHDLQGSDTVQVRERSSPDPNESATAGDDPETQGTSEIIITVPDAPLDLENTGGFGDLPENLRPPADPNESSMDGGDPNTQGTSEIIMTIPETPLDLEDTGGFADLPPDGSLDTDPNEGVPLEPVEFLPGLVPQDDGSIWLAPEEDGFGDLGDTDSRPSEETVTYFDRPWIPRTWQTGDTQSTQVNIYDAATCLATAAALANYTEGASDVAIAEQIRAAIRHMQAANQYSFAPHKAWPDWEQRAYQFNVWAKRITQTSQRQRDIARKQLHGYLTGQANGMRTQLETLRQGQAGSVQNCDSLLFQVGHHLAYAAQLKLIAEAGLSAGKDQFWANRILSRVNNSKATAARLMGMMQPSANRQGCPDMKDLAERVRTVQVNLPDTGQAMLALWQEGQDLLQRGKKIDIFAAGKYVFAIARSFGLRGLTDIQEDGLYFDKAQIRYWVWFNEPSVTGRPSSYVSLTLFYVEQMSASTREYVTSPLQQYEWRRVLQVERFERLGGRGVYSCAETASQQQPASNGCEAQLTFEIGNWLLLLQTRDVYAGVRLFGSPAGHYKYLFGVLDALAPRAVELTHYEFVHGKAVKVNQGEGLLGVRSERVEVK
jgi:hypothetical protein